MSYRQFKVMNDRFPKAPSFVPWDFVAPYENGAQRNHGQTLERLNQRGGLSVCELLAIIENRRWHQMDPVAAVQTLDLYLSEYRAKQESEELTRLRSELAESKEEIGTLSKELCEMEDWLLGTRETWGVCDGGKRLKERIRDLIALEGEVGDLRAELEYLKRLNAEIEKGNNEYVAENAALKSEIEALRKDKERLELLESAISCGNGPKIGFNDDPDTESVDFESGFEPVGYYIHFWPACEPAQTHTGESLRQAIDNMKSTMQTEKEGK